MNSHVAKPLVAVGLGMGVWAALLACFPYPFSLAWPGLVLARLGVPHSWVFAVLCVFGLLAGTGLWARGRAWWQVAAVSLLLSEAYAFVAFLYVARLPVPLPTVTPFDSSAIHRKEYLEAYDGGYRDGMMGLLRSYCFRPESETRGAEDGARAGIRVWFRLMGRRTPEWLDGAHLDTAPLGSFSGLRCPHRLGKGAGTATRTLPPRSHFNKWRLRSAPDARQGVNQPSYA